ncbi:MAG: flagellar biosynthetic protein FliR, partial [Bacteroidota bacterium]|nr:flagellar biosynthetic protein FliR [Bacteroidota bacterium]
MTNIFVVDFILVLMIFLRISAAFVVAPIFSNQALPTTLKMVLALTISYIIFLTINREPNTIQINLFSLFFNGLKEVMTGLLLGFMLNFVFYGINYAGTLIGFDMQLT